MGEVAEGGRILVVDDDVEARGTLADLLRERRYDVEVAADGFKALPKLAEFDPDLLLTDLMMPGLDGMGLLERSLADDQTRPVILMTAFGAIDNAIDAMKAGAYHYVSKPLQLEEVLLVVERALERRRLKRQTEALRHRLHERHHLGRLVGTSPSMLAVYEAVRQVAPTKATVLVTGESGTGKELVAAAIHEESPRAGGPFVRLHCGALAETLLESELFGHEKGAFTGAVARRDGRFAQAHGGTLFIDEIGEISPALQVKLLRFLQEHEFERVGGNQTLKVDVRVVAATHRDLAQMVRDRQFREDLHYRLNVVEIHMPPLRDRPGDVPLLAMHFLRRFAAENHKSVTGFSEDALAKLLRYRWPGNVRELENAIERAVVLCRDSTIEALHLAPSVGNIVDNLMPAIPGASLDEIERYVILKTLEHTGGSTSRAAEILGISARKIQYKLHDYQKR